MPNAKSKVAALAPVVHCHNNAYSSEQLTTAKMKTNVMVPVAALRTRARSRGGLHSTISHKVSSLTVVVCSILPVETGAPMNGKVVASVAIDFVPEFRVVDRSLSEKRERGVLLEGYGRCPSRR